MDLNHALQIGITAAKEAGEYLLRQQSKIKVVSQKTSTDWLLEQDKHAEKIIITKIREAFPDHSILAEESGLDQKHAHYKWIIDPLDGSFNYQRGWPLYGSIIGLYVKDLIKVAVIFLPKFDELYTAVDKGGTYLNGKKIHVSTVSDLKGSIIVVGDYNKNNNQKIIKKQLNDMKLLANHVGRVRMVGSSALDHALIASGKVEALINRGGKPWDLEVGKKLIEEAGGVATRLSDEDNGLFLFGNKLIHKQLSALLK
jgi:myo-inositol-1(or 4)-monophosphatase